MTESRNVHISGCTLRSGDDGIVIGADRRSGEAQADGKHRCQQHNHHLALLGHPRGERPFVPRGGERSGHRALLWMRGRYATYEDFATSVVGVVD